MSAVAAPMTATPGPRPLRVAILGARCLPARYGGTETFSEILARGLVERGHEVTVYACEKYQTDRSPMYEGIRRIVLPAINTAALEKFSYASLSFIHVCFTDADVILMNQIGAGPMAILPRIFGKQVVINPDGLEWKRKRWGRFGRAVLKLFEWVSAHGADALAADSQAIADYLEEAHGVESVYIPYGATPQEFENLPPVPESAGVTPGEYVIQVCRLEPDNNAHVVISEFEKTSLSALRVVGGSPYSHEYGQSLQRPNDPRIRLLGGIFGENYRSLMKNAMVYIHGHEVGGTNPVLLDSMAAGQCVIALDVPFNREVLGDAGLYFTKEPGNLAAQLERVAADPALRARLGEAALRRVKAQFTWNRCIVEHEALFKRLRADALGVPV